MFSWAKQALFGKSAGEKFAEEIARRSLDEGDKIVIDRLDRQTSAIMQKAVFDAELAAHLAKQGNLAERVVSFEIPFMWGIFHEFVQTQYSPTNGYDRIMVHMMRFLMHHRGFAFGEARAHAIAANEMFNADDALFMAIAKRGMKSFHNPEMDDTLVRLLSADVTAEREV